MDPLPKNNYRDFSQLAKEAARVEIPEWDMPFNETEVGYHALLKKNALTPYMYCSLPTLLN